MIGSACLPTIQATARSACRTGTLTVHVDPIVDHPDRLCGLETLLEAVGVPWRVSFSDWPAIYYGSNPRVGQAAGLWIPADQHSDWTRVPPNWTLHGKLPVAFRGSAPTRVQEGNRLTFDLALATHFWLSLGSQRLIGERDVHGRVPSDHDLLVRLGCLQDPPVLGYAALVKLAFERMTGGADLHPIWPDSKRFAVCLTHDVDLPERERRTSAHLRDLLIGVRDRRRSALYSLESSVQTRGFADTFFAGATQRREWDFARFIELEAECGFQSAFYFSTVHRGEGHDCDVAYDSSLHRYRSLFKRLRFAGCEVGLHAGYGTRENKPSIEEQVGRFRERAEHAPEGVRFHYLRFDARDPLGSLRACDQAGLRYDTSLGFTDRAGFRTGHALPYFVGKDRRSPRFVELPMSLADMHLHVDDVETATRISMDHIERVRRMGGLAVLNWHVGHWRSHPAWREAYVAVCQSLAADSDVWVARPGDIADWWRRRREGLCPSRG